MMWRLGVIGSPVAHSLSPRIHQAALSALGLEGTSEAIDLDLSHVTRVPALLETHQGLAVTMPLKRIVVDLCDRVDERAQRIGSVNSLLMRAGRIEGCSTDGAGLLNALRDDLSLDVANRNVVVRGSGGSAAAIVDALHDACAKSICLLARNHTSADVIAARYDNVDVNPVVVSDVTLVVNTIPHSDRPVHLANGPRSYTDDAVALDIVYEPRETPWMREQAERGLRTVNGLSMLAHQAQLQLSWWLDQPVPLKPLMEAVGL